MLIWYAVVSPADFRPFGEGRGFGAHTQAHEDAEHSSGAAAAEDPRPSEWHAYR